MPNDHPTLIPAVRYREVQWIFRNPIVMVLIPTSFLTMTFLLLGLYATSPTPQPELLWVWLGIAVMEVLLALLLRIETVVTDVHLTVRPIAILLRRRIPLEAIDEVESIKFNPLGDAGGWGIRSSRKFGRVYNAYGDRGVRIVAGDTRLLIGSQRPDELAAAINAALADMPPSARKRPLAAASP